MVKCRNKMFKVHLFFVVFFLLKALPALAAPLISSAGLCGRFVNPPTMGDQSEGEISHETLFKVFEKLEKEIDRLTQQTTLYLSSNFRFKEILVVLIRKIEEQSARLSGVGERLLRLEEEGVADAVTTSAETLEDIKKQLEEIDREISFITIGHSCDTKRSAVSGGEVSDCHSTLLLNTLIQNPHLVEPETPYLTIMTGGTNPERELRVVFSNKVVKELLRNAKINRDILTKILGKIKLGIFGENYKGDGVIVVSEGQFGNEGFKVVKVRNTRDTLRIFGYLRDDSMGQKYFHVVSYSRSSNHDIANIRAMAKLVIESFKIRCAAGLH
ncbi:MAG: hypothetical protein K1X29_07855 [Bdellovibrionales bacterium]|nr:hypothetical protein [Bdellovibrionales bacterium]